MVILAAAAITAAGVGAYQGGKAVVTDVNKKIRRSTTQRNRTKERKEQNKMNDIQRQETTQNIQNMSINDRVNRFKQNIPNEQPSKKGLLFRK